MHAAIAAREFLLHLQHAHASWLWGALAFLLSAVGSAALTGLVLVRLPSDYFLAGVRPAGMPHGHPFKRFLVRWLRNLGGVTIIVVGVLLSLPGVPGQGLLTILIGLMLLDFEAVRRLERWLLLRPSVLGPVNRLRARFGRAPLDIDRVP